MLAAGAPAGPPPQEGKLQQELQQMHSEASSLLLPYLGPSVRPEAVEDLDRLRRACELLERINALSPSHWRIWWSLGMARRRLKDRQGAYAAFQRAYRLQPDVVETGRNLFAECADLGYGEEALRLSKAILQLAPDDPGVVSNHAVALLINGDLDGAMEAVKHASSLDPQGQTTINLRNFLEEIRAGRIPVPTRIDTW
jgi:Flp pilus assembly protein TadD